MKGLEALEIVDKRQSWDCFNDEPHEDTEEEIEAYEMLKKALTPPTSEEVCDEIKKISKCENVYYEKYFKKFVIVLFGEHYKIDLNDHLFKDNPHLITLIGRFYQGEVE